MSMRVLGALGFTLAAMTGGAHASSIVFLGVSTSTPSVIKVGGSEPVRIASSPSIVALGDAQPDVTYEKVAAIPEKPRQDPMIIRGGIVGRAFAAPAPASASTSAPAAETTAETAPAGTATASIGKPESQPAAPQPAATPQQPIEGVGKAE
ncbi:hypothetical protein [Mesorhizobium sp. M0676]|uniref:hypothetical protein n=1 Tax=Mesorhizobium sp. M0676 TaxID=2956984 RepID=UPI00333B5A13